MKTMEEKRDRLLSYCNEVCPPGTGKQVVIDGITLEWIDHGDVMTGGLRLYGVADWMYIEPEMDDHVVNYAYKLLLEAKDERAFWQGLAEEQKKVDGELAMFYAGAEVKWIRTDADNRKLVEMLVAIYKPHAMWYPHTTGWGKEIEAVLDNHHGNDSWNEIKAKYLAGTKKGGAGE